MKVVETERQREWGGGTWREGEENGERRERETERRAILVFFFFQSQHLDGKHMSGGSCQPGLHRDTVSWGESSVIKVLLTLTSKKRNIWEPPNALTFQVALAACL